MKTLRHATALVAGFIIASTGLSLPAAHADTSTNITTSPIASSLSVTPGNAVTTTLSVQNNGTKPLAIQIKLQKFRALGTAGEAQIYAPSPADPSLGWVHFSQTTIQAEPGVWNNVKMTINVPKAAAYGYYYAVLFAPDVSTKTPTKNTNTVKGANAVLVLLNARTANEKERLTVQSFTAAKSSIEYLPQTFQAVVRNTGNIFTAPSGDVYISRTKTGPALASLDINPGVGNVLPDSSRAFSVSWSDGFPAYQLKRQNNQIVSDPHGKPESQLNWNFSRASKFRFGKYYAHLVLVYNNGIQDVPVSSYISFWVIPWKLLLLAFVALLLIVLGIWSLVRPLVRRRKTSGKTMNFRR